MALPVLRRNSKLWIDGPLPDESISSIFDRAGALMHSGRDVLHSILADRAHVPGAQVPVDWDDPPEETVDLLAAALDVDPAVLDELRIKDGPSRVHPGIRNIYCPRCFFEDLEVGRPSYFRREWTDIARTFCRAHGLPLIDWPRTYKWCGRRLTVGLNPSVVEPTVKDDKILRRVQQAVTHFRPYSIDSGWPGSSLCQQMMAWEQEFSTALRNRDGSSKLIHPRLQLTMDLLLVLGLNQDPFGGWPPAGHLTPRSLYWELRVHRGPEMPTAGPNPVWDQFRTLNADRRRAAYFMAAACLESGWPVTAVLGLPRDIASGSAEWWHCVIRPVAGIFVQEKLEGIRVRLGIPAFV